MQKNKKIFVASLAIIGVLFVCSVIKGKDQIAQRKNDYIEYISAKENIQAGTQLEGAVATMEKIGDKYINTTQLVLQKMQAYKIVGNYKKLQQTIEEMLELDKTLESNFTMLLLYAETALQNKDTKIINNIVKKINLLELTEDQKELVKELQERIG